MPVDVSYIDEENRLDLSFQGNLDVTVSRDIAGICKRVSASLRTCIIDLSNVERMFDSGVALLQMLNRRLGELKVTVVILSDRPEIRERVPAIAGTSAYPLRVGHLGHFVLSRYVEPGHAA